MDLKSLIPLLPYLSILRSDFKKSNVNIVCIDEKILNISEILFFGYIKVFFLDMAVSCGV